MNLYKGWKGEDELFDPHPDLRTFLYWCSISGWEIVVYTTRPVDKVNAWLKNHKLEPFIKFVTNSKPLALVYVDDRAIRFSGDFSTIMAALESMEIRTHWEQEVQK